MTINEMYDKYFAIHNASNDIEKIRCHLNLSPDLVKSKSWQEVAMNAAAGRGNVPLLELLTSYGIDVNILYCDIPIIDSAISNNQFQAVRWLVNNGTNLNRCIQGKRAYSSALESAIINGNMAIVQLLVEAGAMINGIGPRGMTPLDWARGSEEIAAYLRSRGGVSARELPGYKPPVDKGPIITRIEQCYGPVHEFAWQYLLPDGIPIAVRCAWNSQQRYGALFTEGMSKQPMNVPEGKELFRYAELMLTMDDWPANPSDWNTPEWNWPIHWLQQLSQLPFQSDTWLDEPVGIISNGDPHAPLGPNTQMTTWLLISNKDPIDEFIMPDGKHICFYTLMPIYTEECEYALEHGVVELLRLFEQHRVYTNVIRDRLSVVGRH